MAYQSPRGRRGFSPLPPVRQWAVLFALLGWLASHPPLSAQKRVLEGVKFEHLTTRNGLSQDGVICVAQDDLGFLWFGTRDGLNRYDGQRFKVYHRDFQDDQTLVDNQVIDLTVAGDGSIWTLHLTGLSRLDPVTGRFQRFPMGAEGSPKGQYYWSLNRAPDSGLYVATTTGFARFDPETQRFEEIVLPTSKDAPVQGADVVCRPGEAFCWLATDAGLFRYDPEQGVLEDPPLQGPPGKSVFVAVPGPDGALWLRGAEGIGLFDPDRMTYEAIDFGEASWPAEARAMAYDSRGMLWITTRLGVVVYDHQTGRSARLRHNSGDPRSLSQDHVTDIFEDRSGMIWVGTFGGGVNLYNRAAETISHIRLDHEVANNYNFSIFGFATGKDGEITIATASRGLFLYNPEQETVTPGLAVQMDNPDLDMPMVADLLPGEDGHWAATDQGLKWYEPARRAWRDVAVLPPEVAEKVSVLFEDLEYGPNEEIYIATSQGLMVYEPHDGSHQRWIHDPDDPKSLPHNRLLALTYSESGLWVGSAGQGLFLLDRETGFRHFQGNGSDPHALSSGFILDLISGADGRIWIGTLDGGLNVFDPKVERFTRYTRKDGLINEKVFGLAFDNDGFLWLGTNRGLSRFDPKTESFRNFDLSHNLQANEFGRGAIMRGSDGTMFFGGVNGFNTLSPKNLSSSIFEAPIVVSEIKVLNQSLVFEKEPANLEAVTFAHDDRALTFQFAALDFRSPQNLSYAYRVEGLADDWVFLENKGEVSFPKLPAGHYELEVRVSDADGQWVPKTRKLAITVTPPWWANPIAYVTYLFLGLLLVGLFVRRWQNRLQAAEAINERLIRVDRLKDEFLANTSHELRTPIHGLVGLAESLLTGVAGPVTAEMAQNLELMVLSGKRLDTLVNDILDLAKLKQHELVLHLQPVDPASVVDAVLAVCRPLADDKKITLINEVDEGLPFVNADEARLQQVLFNLVGNAVKFSQGGEVRIRGERHNEKVRIAVHDQGIGFDPALAEKLFESFQQGDGSTTREFGGTGLGLAISRQLIERMAGRIWAEGQPGRGAVFTFELGVSGEKTLTVYRTGVDGRAAVSTLPINPIVLNPQSVGDSVAPAAVAKGSEHRSAPSAVMPTTDRPIRILAVDDEVANRRILANFLQVQRYEVVLAANGVEALQALEEETFDLVLLDVMMPRMSGFEVCKRIRQTHSLQELPVIFLTAKNQTADVVTAFELGANDYLSKPFSRDTLLSRVKPHLELLDINRHLEQKVAERTRSLQAYARELETLDRIVKTINREMSAEGLLPTLLRQGMALFESVRCGTLMLRDIHNQNFQVVTENQCNAFLKKRAFEENEVRKQFLTEGYQLEEDTFYMPLPEGEAAGWFLIVALVFDGRLEGVMFLQTERDPSRVAKTEFTRLHRFREHAVVAVGRVKTLRELVDKQRERIATAHLVGMAENASTVLHNMGNSLNSINISSEVIEHKLGDDKWTTLADRLLAHYQSVLAVPEEGGRLSEALQQLFGRIEHRDALVLEELRRLRAYLNQSLAVLREQHALSGLSETVEPVEVTPLLQACTQAVEIAGLPIQFSLRETELPTLFLPKIKFMLMMAGLLRYLGMRAVENGVQVHECAVKADVRDRQIHIHLFCSGGGLAADQLDALFEQHKAGALHNSANLAREIGGSLHVDSEGPDHGLTITVVLAGASQPTRPQLVAG